MLRPEIVLCGKSVEKVRLRKSSENGRAVRERVHVLDVVADVLDRAHLRHGFAVLVDEAQVLGGQGLAVVGRVVLLGRRQQPLLLEDLRVVPAQPLLHHAREQLLARLLERRLAVLGDDLVLARHEPPVPLLLVLEQKTQRP